MKLINWIHGNQFLTLCVRSTIIGLRPQHTMDYLYDYYLVVIRLELPSAVKNRIVRCILEANQVMQALGCFRELPGRTSIIGYVYFNREHDMRALFSIITSDTVSDTTRKWIHRVWRTSKKAILDLEQTCATSGDTIESLHVLLTLSALELMTQGTLIATGYI